MATTRGQVKQQIRHITALVGENPSRADVESWEELRTEAAKLCMLVSQMHAQARSRKPAAEQDGMGEEFGDDLQDTRSEAYKA